MKIRIELIFYDNKKMISLFNVTEIEYSSLPQSSSYEPSLQSSMPSQRSL